MRAVKAVRDMTVRWPVGKGCSMQSCGNVSVKTKALHYREWVQEVGFVRAA